MLNTKKLVDTTRKWQKAAGLSRKRIMSTRTDDKKHSAMVARRGHLFVYSSDGRRFMIPLTYLASSIFRELFRMSEEEFGLPSDGPVMLPCDASCMEYIMSLLPSQVPADVEREVLASMASSKCLMSSIHSFGHEQHHHVICGF